MYSVALATDYPPKPLIYYLWSTRRYSTTQNIVFLPKWIPTYTFWTKYLGIGYHFSQGKILGGYFVTCYTLFYPVQSDFDWFSFRKGFRDFLDFVCWYTVDSTWIFTPMHFTRRICNKNVLKGRSTVCSTSCNVRQVSTIKLYTGFIELKALSLVINALKS